MVAIVRDVQQEKRLRERVQEINRHKPPGIWLKSIEENPTASQHRRPQGDFHPHGAVGLKRDVPFGKEIVQTAA